MTYSKTSPCVSKFLRTPRLHRSIPAFLFLFLFLMLALFPAFAGGSRQTQWQAIEESDSWDHEIDLSEYEAGTYNVIVRTRDLAGNESIEGPFNLRVDPASDLPTARTVYPAEGEIVRGNINIVGVALDDDALDYVEVRIDEGNYIRAEGSEYWRAYTEASLIEDGRHSISVRAVDINGLVGKESTSHFVLDTKAPSISIDSHSSGAIVGGTVLFRGIASDANGISDVRLRFPSHEKIVRNELQQIDESVQSLRPRIDRRSGEASFEFRVNTRELPDGPYVVWLEAQDETGSELVSPFLFFVDNLSPEIRILNPEAGSPAHGRVVITGSIRDQVGIERFWYQYQGQDYEIPLTPGNPYWTVDISTMGIKGRNIDLSFLALDSSGNQSRLTYRLQNDIEGARPGIEIFQPAESAGSRQPRIVEPGDTLSGRVYGVNRPGIVKVTGLNPNDPRETAEFDAEFGFSIPLSSLLPGRRRLTLSALDQYGNESLPTQLELLVRSEAPQITLESLSYNSRTDERGEIPWFDGIEYDLFASAVVRGRIRSNAKINSVQALIGPRALELGQDPPASDLKASRISPRAAEGGYTFEVPISPDIGFGPQSLRLRVEDEFGSVSLLSTQILFRDIRKLEIEPQILIEDSNIHNGILTFYQGRPIGGRVFTRAAGVENEQVLSIELVLPEKAQGLDPEALPEPASLVRLERQGTSFTLLPGLEGRLEGLKIRAEIDEGVFIETQSFSVVVDSTSPRLSLSSGESAGIQVSRAPEGQATSLLLGGSILEANEIAAAQYSLDGGITFQDMELRPGTSSGEQNFRLNLDFGTRPQNAYGFMIRVVDRAGNASSLSRTINTRSPEALPLSDPQKPRRNDRPTIEILSPGRNAVFQAGTDALITGIIVDLDGASALEMEGPDGQFRRVLSFEAREHYQAFSLPLASYPVGRHSLRLRALDRFSDGDAGISATVNVSFSITSNAGDIVLDDFTAGKILPLGAQHEVTGKITGSDRITELSWEIPGITSGRLSPKASSDNPLDKDFSLRIPSNLPYSAQNYELVIRAVELDGRILERSLPFYLAHPDPAPLPGKRLEFHSEAYSGGQIKLYTDNPVYAWFNGPPLAAAEFVWDQEGAEVELPGRPIARIDLHQGHVRIQALAAGRAERVYLKLKDVDGLEYLEGPFEILVDLAAPELQILSPRVGSYLAQGPEIELQVKDDSQAPLSLSYFYRLNKGEWQRFNPALLQDPLLQEALLQEEGAGEEGDSGNPDIPQAQGNNPGESSLLAYQISLAGQEQGPQLLDIKLVDASGKESQAGLSFFYDNLAPEIEFLTPLPDEAVNGRTLVSGRILSQSPIDQIRHRIAQDGFITLAADQSFAVEVDFSELANREATWILEARDRAGNIASASPGLKVDLEADLPQVQIQIPVEDSVQAEDFVVSGMAFDDDRIQNIVWRLDGGAWREIPGGNNFELPFVLDNLRDNEHLIEVYAVDMFGLAGPVSRRNFRVSLREPVISLTSPLVSETNKGLIELQGKAQDENGIQEVFISLDNGTSFYSVSGTEDWSYLLDSRVFTDGTYSIQIRAVDNYGIEGQYFTLVNVDNTLPLLELDLPAESSEVSGTLNLVGRVTDNSGIKTLSAVLEPINREEEAREYELSTDTVIQQSLELEEFAPGWYNIRITASDLADNQVSLDRNILVQERILSSRVSILFPLQGETHHGQVVVEGRVESPHEVNDVRLYLDGIAIGSAEVNKLGYFQAGIDTSRLIEGARKLQAVIEPVAGERIESNIRDFVFKQYGPHIRIDSHRIGDFIADRPWINGSVGYSHNLDPEDRSNREALKAYELKTLRISLDNGRSFTDLKPEANWRYRIETGDLPPGPLAVIVQAQFANGEQATVRSLYTVDKTRPELSLLGPAEGSLLNSSVLFHGTVWDDHGIDSLEISLRPGDKAGYSVPEFIQGMYLDLDLWGLTYWKIGLGFTFFEDAVKLQANFGIGPETTSSGETARLSGYFIGGKLLANVFSLPFEVLFGPDWDWLSMNFAIGADFSYILLYDPILKEDPLSGKVEEVPGVVLSAIIFQLEFPRVRIKSWDAFNAFSFYTEPEIWFVPSDVDPKIEFKLTFGFRIGLF